MPAPRVLTTRQESQLTRSYANGKRTSELAKHYGVHRSTVIAIVHRRGGSVRTRGKVPAAR